MAAAKSVAISNANSHQLTGVSFGSRQIPRSAVDQQI
jgi:hypothetical protein